MKMHKDGGAEAPPILVHLRSYDPHTRGGLRPRSLVRSTGPRSASFARCAVVAGAFVRSGTYEFGWSLSALASGRICRQSSSTGAGSSEAVTPIVAEPVQQPMPPTECPKLRQMREMVAAEEAAKAQNHPTRRQAAAIQKWQRGIRRKIDKTESTLISDRVLGSRDISSPCLGECRSRR